MPDPMHCGRKTRSGKPCKNRPVTGATVCRMHGGSAPQVRKAALVRATVDEARRMAARAGVDVHPVDHLLDCLHTAAQQEAVWAHMVADLDDAAEVDLDDPDAAGKLRGRHEWAVRETGTTKDGEPRYGMVLETDRLMVANREGTAQLHPFVLAHERALERKAKFAKMCLDAGIDERRQRIAELDARRGVEAFEGALDDAGLTVEQRQRARRAFAERLRAA